MPTKIGGERLEQSFTTGEVRGINAQHADKLRRLLAMLHTAQAPDGQWAVWVSGNWRLVFEFGGGDAVSVDLVDYH